MNDSKIRICIEAEDNINGDMVSVSKEIENPDESTFLHTVGDTVELFFKQIGYVPEIYAMETQSVVCEDTDYYYSSCE